MRSTELGCDGTGLDWALWLSWQKSLFYVMLCGLPSGGGCFTDGFRGGCTFQRQKETKMGSKWARFVATDSFDLYFWWVHQISGLLCGIYSTVYYYKQKRGFLCGSIRRCLNSYQFHIIYIWILEFIVKLAQFHDLQIRTCREMTQMVLNYPLWRAFAPMHVNGHVWH